MQYQAPVNPSFLERDGSQTLENCPEAFKLARPDYAVQPQKRETLPYLSKTEGENPGVVLWLPQAHLSMCGQAHTQMNYIAK